MLCGMPTYLDTVEAADRIAYDGWIAGQLDQIHASASVDSNGFDVWDHGKLAAARLPARDDADAYRGPWHTVRPYLTREALWWFEAEGMPRLTFGQWQDQARAARRAAREAASDPRNLLDALAYARDMMARRGDMIAELREAGIPWAEIMAASGLSRSQCNALRRAADEPF